LRRVEEAPKRCFSYDREFAIPVSRHAQIQLVSVLQSSVSICVLVETRRPERTGAFAEVKMDAMSRREFLLVATYNRLFLLLYKHTP
jgi:hypothetical protein